MKAIPGDKKKTDLNTLKRHGVQYRSKWRNVYQRDAAA